jgi:hypothetical protein
MRKGWVRRGGKAVYKKCNRPGKESQKNFGERLVPFRILEEAAIHLRLFFDSLVEPALYHY